jgi:hypothetical protein
MFDGARDGTPHNADHQVGVCLRTSSEKEAAGSSAASMLLLYPGTYVVFDLASSWEFDE